MKKKIGEIYNIPIIIGDKNLKTKSEIHVDDLSNVVGGGAGNAESTMEYLDVSGLDEANIRRFLIYGYIAKFSNDEATFFLPTAHPYIASISGQLLPNAISIDFTTVITFTDNSQNMTIKEALLQTGSTPITEEELAAIPRITKEQFYNLEA